MNVSKNPDGTWNSHVQVAKKKDPDLWEVIDRSPKAIERYPDTPFGRTPTGLLYPAPVAKGGDIEERGGSFGLFTRIWAAVTPKTGMEPGYCAVVGEVHDGSFEPHVRPYVLLDEGVALEVESSLALHPDLFEATCGLKDIYRFDRIFIDFKNEQFVSEIQKMQWGIVTYPDEEDITESRMKEIYPFYDHRDRVIGIMEAPYTGNDEYDFSTVDSLFARGRLKHHACCQIWKSSQYRTPHRALAMVCSALQFWDWSEVLREQEVKDGYEDFEASEEERDEEEEWEANLLSIAAMAGDTSMREVLETERLDGYRRIVGAEYAE